MNTDSKDFKVKNGLKVAGTATFDNDILLNQIPISYDQQSKRLKMYINNQWSLIALDADIINTSDPLDGGSPSTSFSSIAILDGGVVA